MELNALMADSSEIALNIPEICRVPERRSIIK